MRALATEMRDEAAEHDPVWDVVAAMRRQGYDCSHTRGSMRVKVVQHVESIDDSDPPLHILEVRISRNRPDVFILTTLE